MSDACRAGGPQPRGAVEVFSIADGCTNSSSSVDGGAADEDVGGQRMRFFPKTAFAC